MFYSGISLLKVQRGRRIRHRQVDRLGDRGVVGWPPSARVQRGERLRRIGVLVRSIRQDAIRLGLRDLGYVEGENILVEYRPAGGSAPRTSPLSSSVWMLI